MIGRRAAALTTAGLISAAAVAGLASGASAAVQPVVANFATSTGHEVIDSTHSVAQVFTAPATGSVQTVTAVLSATSAANATIALYAVDAAGKPTGAAPLAAHQVAVQSATPMYYSVPAVAAVTAGTAYAVVISSASTLAWSTDGDSSFPAAFSGQPLELGQTWAAVTDAGRALFGVTLSPSTGTLVSTVQLDAGSLGFVTVPAAPSIPDLTLNGRDQTTAPFDWPIDVNDATGSGSGWSVTLSATPFTSPSGTLPSTALSLLSPGTTVCDTGVTCTAASTTVAANQVLTPGSSNVIYQAAANSGLGAQTITPQLALTVPANARAGAYSSTWTVSISSGP